ncbi:hypothetical protein EVAR_19573_1 [Eumeta japonica]|uniref:Uncharacterized protein n=1 Tax=Eumeta variegata TaxID=151549 RepID=A0A4C1UF28_EUMVA|nr:hypothetical protein EVAR_19573_1 [Eumeta japonica]
MKLAGGPTTALGLELNARAKSRHEFSLAFWFSSELPDGFCDCTVSTDDVQLATDGNTSLILHMPTTQLSLVCGHDALDKSLSIKLSSRNVTNKRDSPMDRILYRA